MAPISAPPRLAYRPRCHSAAWLGRGEVFLLVLFLAMSSPTQSTEYDVILRGGQILDGSGGLPRLGDVAFQADRIAAVGDLRTDRGRRELSVAGLALAPGFINMLSWANESLLEDGRSQSDLRQGVTLEVLGEGESMGPLNDAMKRDLIEQQGDLRYEVPWTTLSGYLTHLERRGISCNVASFVGATSVRVHELGYADRPPSAEELERMKQLVAQAMQEGALGLSSALIYAPATYAKTDELIALARVAAEHDGLYVSHLRSEGDRFLEALDEFLTIAREARIPAHIYHLKASGRANWNKLEQAIGRMEAARAAGQRITADMYCYTAGATGLDAAMPPWVQEGGYQAWANRLRDPAVRARVKREMNDPAGGWENFFLAAGSPDQMLFSSFRQEKLKPLTGRTLAEVARARGTSPEETAMDLVIEDGSRVGTVYFLMSEENVRRQLKLPWVAFDSDAASLAPEGKFLRSNPHPRAYGNFARLLGRYVREEQIIPLPEAIRRLTSLPADILRLEHRGRLQPGAFADVVAFDPGQIQDHATFERPHQYSTGVQHVFVNGVQVLRDGEHTGARPGRWLRGPRKQGLPPARGTPN